MRREYALRLPGEDDLPRRWVGGRGLRGGVPHQGSSAEHCPTGVRIPSRMDSRIPGTDSR